MLSAPAFANKDIIYASGATATVSDVLVGVTNNFNPGGNGSTALNEAVYAGQAVKFTVTWSLQDRSAQPGQDTIYSKSVIFTRSTTATPGPTVSVDAIPNCTVTSSVSTCTTDVSFAAPATVGNYQVQVQAEAGGSNGIADTTLSVNFSVATPVVLLEDTKLAVAKQCVLLNAGEVDLTATLTELLSGDPIASADVGFFLDPEIINDVATSGSIGGATTDSDGVATLTHDVNTLGVGDYNLYAEYAGSSSYNPSNGSNVLGVSYLFVGFQQPINPDGTSIFGNGRVLPVKIRVVDANNQPVANAAPTVWLTQYSSSTGLGSVLEEATSVSAADTGNIMRFVPEDGHYIYNMDLSTVTNGTYAVVVDLGDSAACTKGPYYAIITVKKKK
jgi:hypothetical protein